LSLLVAIATDGILRFGFFLSDEILIWDEVRLPIGVEKEKKKPWNVVATIARM
jgi:hypothetical protein